MLSLLSFTALIAAIASAAPAAKRDKSSDGVNFPLPNGFPNPNPDAILQIQLDAHGTLPNGAPPASLSPEGATNLKLIALNELFEVAFFTELVYNVTSKVDGYDLGYGHDYVLDTLKAITAQEELHVLNANGALKKFNQQPIEPCKYNFPVTNFEDAIALAGTFTDLVLGTLQDVNEQFAKNGDFGLVRAVSSVIGNEGEQEGFFRLTQKKRPSAQPFLTTSVRDFAFTAIQGFVIPGSCPNIDTIPLRTFKGLALLSENIKPENQNLKFSFNFSVTQDKEATKTDDHDTLSLVYINQQNTPIVKSLLNADVKDGEVIFEAEFPHDDFIMNGLTIAAVVKGAGPFADAEAVAAATEFGPALIEID